MWSFFSLCKAVRECRWLPSLFAWALRWRLCLSSSSRCPSFFHPHVMSGGVCPAAMKPLWSLAPELCVGADLSLFCSQVVAPKITQSTSAMSCSSQIYRHGPHITAVQVFKCCHISLNTGIKLWWRKRRNRSVTDRRWKKMRAEGENVEKNISYLGDHLKVSHWFQILDLIIKQTWIFMCKYTILIWKVLPTQAFLL